MCMCTGSDNLLLIPQMFYCLHVVIPWVYKEIQGSQSSAVDLLHVMYSLWIQIKRRRMSLSSSPLSSFAL